MTLSAWLLLYAFPSAAALHRNAPTPPCKCCSGILPRGSEAVLRWSTSATFRRSLFVVLQSGEGIQLTADQRRGLQVLGGRWQASAARIVVSTFTMRSDRTS